jgi:hypothetical protein
MSGARSAEEDIDLFKFYEEAAEKAKGHAWTQSSWVLSLNAGIFVLIANLKDSSFFFHLISAFAGVVLAAYLIYVLGELGNHIRTYWTSSNKIAAKSAGLMDFIGEKDKFEAKLPGYRAEFPRFCRRLQFLAFLFVFAHLGWVVVVAFRGGRPL